VLTLWLNCCCSWSFVTRLSFNDNIDDWLELWKARPSRLIPCLLQAVSKSIFSLMSSDYQSFSVAGINLCFVLLCRKFGTEISSDRTHRRRNYQSIKIKIEKVENFSLWNKNFFAEISDFFCGTENVTLNPSCNSFILFHNLFIYW